jgi:hypothetical protein
MQVVETTNEGIKVLVAGLAKSDRADVAKGLLEGSETAMFSILRGSDEGALDRKAVGS